MKGQILLLVKTLNILTCLELRCYWFDGRTGDSAGILIEIPHDFKNNVISTYQNSEYAVGMVFLPNKINQSNYCIKTEDEIKKQNLKLLGEDVQSKVVGSIVNKTQQQLNKLH